MIYQTEADNSRFSPGNSRNADNDLYYDGQKDKQEQILRKKLVDNNNLDEVRVTRARLSMLLRGQMKWPEATEELRLARTMSGCVSPDSAAQMEAAAGSLLYEQGNLQLAVGSLEAALARLADAKTSDQLRQFVSSRWKAAEIAYALGRRTAAERGINTALRVAEQIGDLHGYCNTRIAEAHIAISQRDFKRAVTSLLWVSHPPPEIVEGQPEPRFIYGELARAWAVLEWRYHCEYSRWFGFVDPLWALTFAHQRLAACQSAVMRVPFLGSFAIASPDAMRNHFSYQLGVPTLGTGRRPRFGRRERQLIFERYEGLCALCGTVINRRIENFQIDHIVQHSVGRSLKGDLLLNYRPTHSKCNSKRGNKDFTHYAHFESNNPAKWVGNLPLDVWRGAF